MKNDAQTPKNRVAVPPNQLPACQHCLIASQGRGPGSVSKLNYLSLFEEVHHV